MNNASEKLRITIFRICWRSESGQAVFEFSLIALLMISLTFGLIDFYRAIYERQVLANLSREGANEAARGAGDSTVDIMSNAVQTVIASSNPFNMANGLVIVTAVTNYGSSYVVSHQVKGGNLSFPASSKVGKTVGGAAILPSETPAILQSNHTVYVAEVFYPFGTVTPIGKLLKIAVTNQFYDVAYFPGG